MEKALNVDIRQFYREDLGVHSEELLDKLEAVSQAVTLQKGEILNKEGERQTMLPFLIEGMMRCVTLDSEGKEKTVGFTMNRGDVVLSNMDLTGCHISTDQAMVPSTLILLPIDYVLQNMKDEPEVIRSLSGADRQVGHDLSVPRREPEPGGRDRAVRMVLQGVSRHDRYGQ